MSGINRQVTKTGLLSAGILLVAALLGIVNYFGWKYHQRFDWTSTALYSLSEKSEKVLKGLDRDVEIVVLLSPQRQQALYGPTHELLDRYAAASRRLKVRFVDPERNPVEAQQLARQFGLENASVVFVSGATKKVVDAGDLAEYDYSSMGMGGGQPTLAAFKGEQKFTNALIQLGQTRVPKVRFTSGHGEAPLDGLEERGLSSLAELLKGDGYAVEEWASLGQASVPADTDLLVIAGPTANFVAPELDAIGAYLDRGGRLLALLDPVLARTTPGLVSTGLEPLLAKYGVQVDNDIVVDPSNPLPMFGAETLFSNVYGQHPIVEPLSRQSLPMLVSLARSVRAVSGPAGAKVTELLKTTAAGWGETNFAALSQGAGKDEADLPGPLGLGVAVGGAAQPQPPTDDDMPAPPPPADDPKAPRLVVFGDSDLATNQFWNLNVGNANAIANAVNWLVERKDLIAIPPKKTEQTHLSLTGSQLRNVWIMVLVLLPGLAVAAAIGVRMRRRRR